MMLWGRCLHDYNEEESKARNVYKIPKSVNIEDMRRRRFRLAVDLRQPCTRLKFGC